MGTVDVRVNVERGRHEGGERSRRSRSRTSDRMSPEQTGRQLARISVLVEEVGTLWLDALEAGVYAARRETNGRGTGFEETDPTSRAALSPTQRQLRGKVKRASVLIEQAMERLEEAASTLTDGFLLTDEEVLGRFLEKRAAAIQGRRE